MKIILARFFLSIFYVGWLIWGNIYYYGNYYNWYDPYYYQCDSYQLIIFILILIGYFEMLKCCCIGTCAIIMIPVVLQARRNAQRPNWIPAPPNFLQNLAKTKFDPSSDGVKAESCSICLLDYQENDQVIPLPCDEKHVFHEECIKEWLKKNNCCPLCKKPITQEAIKT